jgi:hypothetical protein
MTVTGRLAALGFADTAGAERLLAGQLHLDVLGADEAIVAALAAAADPDLALTGLARLPRDERLPGRACAPTPACGAGLPGWSG